MRELYADLIDERAWHRAPKLQLRLMAARLSDGHRDRRPGALVELTNWHPWLAARPAQEIWPAALTDQDFLATLAREHGYPDWAGVLADHTNHPSGPFESAVESVLTGELGAVTAALDADPTLVTGRSHWPHRATLLHYLAANGVETHRQRVPTNAPAIAELLLANGAHASARATMYGTSYTALDLMLTSRHPAEAGVADALAQVLAP